jgi:hypothetical protein
MTAVEHYVMAGLFLVSGLIIVKFNSDVLNGKYDIKKEEPKCD